MFVAGNPIEGENLPVAVAIDIWSHGQPQRCRIHPRVFHVEFEPDRGKQQSVLVGDGVAKRPNPSADPWPSRARPRQRSFGLDRIQFGHDDFGYPIAVQIFNKRPLWLGRGISFL